MNSIKNQPLLFVQCFLGIDEVFRKENNGIEVGI
jgi:hypothetical protein